MRSTDERTDHLGEVRLEFQQFLSELRSLRRLQIKVWVTMVVGFVAVFVENCLR
jgi:hypothetical protein